MRSSYGSKLAVTRSRTDSEVDGDGHGISGNHDSPSASRSRSESAASVSLCQIRFEVTVGDAALVIGGVVVAVSVQPCCLVLGGVHDSHGMTPLMTPCWAPSRHALPRTSRACAWWCRLSRFDFLGRPHSGMALTADTTTSTTIGDEERHGNLNSRRHAVVVVRPGDASAVEVCVDGIVDGVGDRIAAGLDPFEPCQRS